MNTRTLIRCWLVILGVFAATTAFATDFPLIDDYELGVFTFQVAHPAVGGGGGNGRVEFVDTYNHTPGGTSCIMMSQENAEGVLWWYEDESEGGNKGWYRLDSGTFDPPILPFYFSAWLYYDGWWPNYATINFYESAGGKSEQGPMLCNRLGREWGMNENWTIYQEYPPNTFYHVCIGEDTPLDPSAPGGAVAAPYVGKELGWHKVAAYVGDDGSVKYWIDGILVIDQEPGTISSPISHIRTFGANYANLGNPTWHIDDFVVSTTPEDDPWPWEGTAVESQTWGAIKNSF